jgi:hypothetical protein
VFVFSAGKKTITNNLKGSNDGVFTGILDFVHRPEF